MIGMKNTCMLPKVPQNYENQRKNTLDKEFFKTTNP